MPIEVRYIASTDTVDVRSDYLTIKLTVDYIRELVGADELTAKKIMYRIEKDFNIVEKNFKDMILLVKSGVEGGLL